MWVTCRSRQTRLRNGRVAVAAVVAAAAVVPAVAAVVVVAADAGKALRLHLTSRSPAVRKCRGASQFLRSRSPFSSRVRRLLTRDARIPRFTAQTLHRFGAIT